VLIGDAAEMRRLAKRRQKRELLQIPKRLFTYFGGSGCGFTKELDEAAGRHVAW
jgi:hypothetical protein